MFHDLPPECYALLEGRDNAVLLETSRYDAENYRSLLFLDPVETLSVDAVDGVPALLEGVERQLGRGRYVAGYLGYECGYCFERIAPPPVTGPLAWFGVYPAPIVFNHLRGMFEGGTAPPAAPRREARDDGHAISGLRLAMPAGEYGRTIEAIKAHIRAGNTYQINFTTRYAFDFRGSALSLYLALKRGQRVSYGAFIRAGARTVVSLSPELFFRRSGETVVTRPMKGTARRGRTPEEDRANRDWLGRDVKNRAENVMIVDLLRNDLGRISEIGSVTVRDLFAVEKYHTLFQMISTVEGRLKPGVTYGELFRSLFPSGSVTGAPKIRSMQIIRELEAGGRGIYTGSIGYFSPAREAVFNVAIRTVVIEGARGEMGVGSGVVWDSDPDDEYRECELKGAFLSGAHDEFGLIETLLWDDGYPLLRYHMRRITESAEYFDYPCDPEGLGLALAAASRGFVRGTRYRMRLVLDRRGRPSVESAAIEERAERLPRVALSAVRTDSADRFLYHKTTRRPLYDQIHQAGVAAGFADVIFMNERGEVTEGAISNVFIRRGGKLLTPPVRCGLLPGVYRQHLLETRADVAEAVLTLDDLLAADAVYISNAVRGLREVEVSPSYVGLASEAEPGTPGAGHCGRPAAARPGPS